jgi:hypothetical protein
MMQFLRKMMRVPRVSFLRTKKLRPTKNCVTDDISASFSISDDSVSDDTSHSSEQEMNLPYELEDGATFDIDDVGGEKTQNIMFYIDQGLCLNETIGFFDRPLEEDKDTVNSTTILADDRSLTVYNEYTAYYYEDNDMKSIELGTSKKVTFHPDVVSEVMYIKERRSVSSCFAGMSCEGCDSSYTYNKITYSHYSSFFTLIIFSRRIRSSGYLNKTEYFKWLAGGHVKSQLAAYECILQI